MAFRILSSHASVLEELADILYVASVNISVLSNAPPRCERVDWKPCRPEQVLLGFILDRADIIQAPIDQIAFAVCARLLSRALVL